MFYKIIQMVTNEEICVRYYFNLDANLETCRISNDTLHIQALNDDLSWRPTNIPELRTSTIITTKGVVNKSY